MVGGRVRPPHLFKTAPVGSALADALTGIATHTSKHVPRRAGIARQFWFAAGSARPTLGSEPPRCHTAPDDNSIAAGIAGAATDCVAIVFLTPPGSRSSRVPTNAAAPVTPMEI